MLNPREVSSNLARCHGRLGLPKRPKYSRWRRLPTAYWISERKGPDPNDEPQRLTLYLPAKLLDLAEKQASKAGVETIQAYCEGLLARAIEDERAREVLDATVARHGTFEGFDAISNDPEYLAEWTASLVRKDQPTDEPDMPSLPSPRSLNNRAHSSAAETVLRHAGLSDDDPSGFLPKLRRGEPVSAEAASELLQALIDLEAENREKAAIERRLAYALHRLAFEGQVLLTDGWHGAAGDASTVDVLRIVQEGVDRILSGEDIRYYPQAP
jgi:hypothetical protein